MTQPRANPRCPRSSRPGGCPAELRRASRHRPDPDADCRVWTRPPRRSSSSLHDRVPDWLRRLHVWAMAHMPASNRRRLALAVALVAAIVATYIGASRILHFVFPGMDVLAYLGLFIVNWVGAGGLLVPIPGARIVGWLMIDPAGSRLRPTGGRPGGRTGDGHRAAFLLRGGQRGRTSDPAHQQGAREAVDAGARPGRRQGGPPEAARRLVHHQSRLRDGAGAVLGAQSA